MAIEDIKMEAKYLLNSRERTLENSPHVKRQDCKDFLRTISSQLVIPKVTSSLEILLQFL